LEVTQFPVRHESGDGHGGHGEKNEDEARNDEAASIPRLARTRRFFSTASGSLALRAATVTAVNGVAER
jgi:hypothetical protein